MIRLQNIRFAYDGGPPVLEGLDWRLAPGERQIIVGPNGAGKSTLFLVTLGLLQARAGVIEIFGQERRGDRDFRDVRGPIGFLFQNPDDQLFCPTVAEDVAFGPLNLGHSPDEAHAIVHRTLHLLDIEHLEKRYCHRLSGGEKRLVSLATVLAMEPRVLLLDEPTTGLDEPTTDRIVAWLKDTDLTWAVITHDADLLSCLEAQVWELRDGVLVGRGAGASDGRAVLGRVSPQA
ncbi:MAG: energy-coupling factor ABC transporter ATP-binding protein [Proteobacteria bacterium]|nr:energy-coupling factor ABC transporter ATP-binding protein [Pseudomonadota bacterium]